MPGLRDRLLDALYQQGWRRGGYLPERVAALVSRAVAPMVVRRNDRAIQTLRRNLTLGTSAVVNDDLLSASIRSYARMFYEIFALPSWDSELITHRVRATGEPALRTAFADRGAIVVLPHSGNWDLAGAWACSTGMPVSTVAERLADEQFAAFTAFRAGLGMEVISHRDPAAMRRLTSAATSQRLVCLIADRDLTGSGVPVTWNGRAITMPAGPALVARRSGAGLFPAVCEYTPTGMVINIASEVPAQPGRTGLRSMTQQVADFFSSQIDRYPQDWHMFQPFFDHPAPARTDGNANDHDKADN